MRNINAPFQLSKMQEETTVEKHTYQCYSGWKKCVSAEERRIDQSNKLSRQRRGANEYVVVLIENL